MLLSLLALPVALASPLLSERDNGGSTKSFAIIISSEIRQPDGVPRLVTLINGKFPADPIYVNEGDSVELEVYNGLDQATTIHSHGIFQTGSLYSDGVPGVTQLPIEPRSSFTYKYKVDNQYGLYWLHAHKKNLLEDGQRIPLYIVPAPDRPRPFSLISNDTNAAQQMKNAENKTQIVTISDWRDITSSQSLEQYFASGMDPLCMDSLLVNGRGRTICPSAEMLAAGSAAGPPGVRGNLTDRGCIIPDLPILSAPFNLTDDDPEIVSQASGCVNNTAPQTVFEVALSDGYASLTFLNWGGVFETYVSIDHHSMQLYAADGAYVQPQEVHAISVPVGERYAAMVKLTKAGDYPIRFTWNVLPQVGSGYALLRVVDDESKLSKESPTTTEDLSVEGPGSWISFVGTPLNNATILAPLTLKPFPAMAPPAQANATIVLDMSRAAVAHWVLTKDTSFSVWEEDDSVPVLFNPNNAINRNVSIAIPLGTVVDFVFVGEVGAPSHPIHSLRTSLEHGGKAWLLGESQGPFNYSSAAEAQAATNDTINLIDPPLRDGFNTIPTPFGPGWSVIRFVADEPGPIMLHCHLSQHQYTGMALVLAQGVNQSWPSVPDEYSLQRQQSGQNMGGSSASSASSAAAVPASGAATSMVGFATAVLAVVGALVMVAA